MFAQDCNANEDHKLQYDHLLAKALEDTDFEKNDGISADEKNLTEEAIKIAKTMRQVFNGETITTERLHELCGRPDNLVPHVNISKSVETMIEDGRTVQKAHFHVVDDINGVKQELVGTAERQFDQTTGDMVKEEIHWTDRRHKYTQYFVINITKDIDAISHQMILDDYTNAQSLVKFARYERRDTGENIFNKIFIQNVRKANLSIATVMRQNTLGLANVWPTHKPAVPKANIRILPPSGETGETRGESESIEDQDEKKEEAAEPEPPTVEVEPEQEKKSNEQ